MLYTQRPLQEKMTLFWHNHFATANSKVGNAVLMLQQIQLFRDNGLGSFETLLQKVTRDPAMLIWLDNRQNRKGSPNENYAREVQELFTLGIGNYTEQDIKEAARAFTGHTLDRDLTLRLQQEPARRRRQDLPGPDGQLRRRRHPRHPGPQPGDARASSRPSCSRCFVYENPDPSTIDRLASTFTSSGFDIRAVLRDIFTGPEFLSPQAFHGADQAARRPRGRLAQGAQRPERRARRRPQSLRRMGQDLLNPPDVSGWKGGSAWINSSTLFERFNWGNRLAMGRDPSKPYFADVPGQIQAQRHRLARGAGRLLPGPARRRRRDARGAPGAGRLSERIRRRWRSTTAAPST